MIETDRSSLIRSCLEAPEDAAPRLALADYLEEFGGLAADQAAALRDGAGEWLLGPRRMVVWLFPDATWASRFASGDRNLICVVPSQRIGLLVGDAPPDAWPSCRLCATPRDLRVRQGGLWMCEACLGRPHNGRVSHVQVTGEVLMGDLMCVGPDGKFRRATPADTVLGVALVPARDDGTAEVSLI